MIKINSVNWIDLKDGKIEVRMWKFLQEPIVSD